MKNNKIKLSVGLVLGVFTLLGCFAIATFASAAAPTIKVLSPNGGETYQTGSTYQISWSLSNFTSWQIPGDSVQLQLWDASGNNFIGTFCISCFSNSNGGTYSWKVDKVLSQSGAYINVQPGNYKIRAAVVSTVFGHPTPIDFSDNYFTISPQIPYVHISASPTSVSYGGSSTLTWNSASTVTSCVASGGINGWAGNKNTSGAFYTGSLTNTVTYYLDCVDSVGQHGGASVTVTVGQAPNPTVNLTAYPANISFGQNSTLSWNSTNAASCSASWTTSTATSGSKTVYPTSTTTYGITCYGNGGTWASATAVVNVTQTNPTVNLTANPSNIQSGQSSTLTWTSTNATSCSASWTTSTATSGSKTVYPTVTTTYSITCYGASGTTPATSSKTVTVAPPQTPYVHISANPMSVSYGGSSVLTWASTSNVTSCVASGGNNGWAGNRSTNGSYATGYLYTTTTYSIDCTDNLGQHTGASVKVTVSSTQNPPIRPTTKPTNNNNN